MNDTSLPPITYRGSVKNIRHDNEEPYLFFEFSDRYSIYDWGEMPDLINKKGENMARFTNTLYAKLEDPKTWQGWSEKPENLNKDILEDLKINGLVTHRFNGESHVSNIWKVKRIFIPDILEKDYSFYKKQPKTTLVPLEVIFRFGCPKGSSFIKRAKKNEGYVKSLGLTKLPEEGEKFSQVVTEFSTKLEPMDTYLDYSKAKEISSMSDGEFQRIQDLSQIISYRIKDLFDEIGLELWDGKFEFAFMEGVQDRKFMLVDTIAPDEIRLMYKDMPLSKEVLRQSYWGGDWHQAIADYKEKFGNDWKEKMLSDGLEPKKLPSEHKLWVENLYQALAESLENPKEAKEKWPKLYKEYKEVLG